METFVKILTRFADLIVYNWLGLSAESVFGSSLNYFIIGFTEISILVILITYLMGIINSYFPLEKIRFYLDKKGHTWFANLFASMLGVVTPFCSCSSIPLFVGMMQARVPLGVSLSFLITSPLVNEIAIAIFWVSFGWKVTIIYILSGIIIGVLGGLFLDKMGMSQHVADWILKLEQQPLHLNKDKRSFTQRLPLIHEETMRTLKKLIPYIFIGLGIGSFIHGYVPASFFETYISASNPFAVPIAVIAAIPLYIDAVGVLPIVETLVDKGVPLGTAIAFMMGAIGLSFPEALLLKKVMKKKLIFAFFSTIAVGMIISGYVFNMIF